jgi:hypothetical protein
MNHSPTRWLRVAVLGLALAHSTLAVAGAGIDSAPAPARAEGAKAPAAWTDDIDRLVGDALAQEKLPGCVVVVGRASGVVYQKAFGSRALLPEREPMTEDTIFDLA